MEEDSAIAMASRLAQFFALLPKLPHKHGAPMLSLALESIAESGLWRRGVLLPHNEDGQMRWLRNFSWPELFAFVHERLPTEMRFRLWRSTCADGCIHACENTCMHVYYIYVLIERATPGCRRPLSWCRGPESTEQYPENIQQGGGLARRV